jgi:hypothetical protein
VQEGLVLQPLEQGVAERFDEERFHECVGRLAARAMGQGYSLVGEAGFAAACAFDALEHILFAHARLASLSWRRSKRPKL